MQIKKQKTILPLDFTGGGDQVGGLVVVGSGKPRSLTPCVLAVGLNALKPRAAAAVSAHKARQGRLHRKLLSEGMDARKESCCWETDRCRESISILFCFP